MIMTSREIKRISLESGTDLLGILEAVGADKAPRLIEKDGEPLAVVVSPDEYTRNLQVPKSKRLREELLSFAGIWSDLDADALIERVYAARHASPPSAPLEV